MRNKAFYCLFVLFFSFCLNCPSVAEEEVVLKGSVEHTVEKGTPLRLRIISLPMNQQSYLANWDLDGEFIPPKIGDQIVSELSEPVLVDGDLVLAKGTKFYGQVSNIIQPKRFGKDGRVEISFAGLQTPQGKVLKFEEPPSMLTGKERNTGQKIAHGIARVGTYAAGGAALGAVVAQQAAGLILSASNPQYVLATGAGVGLLIGIIGSIIKKGQPGRLAPGDEIAINLQQSLILPVLQPISELPPETLAIPGLNLEVLNKKLVKDDFGKSVLLINLIIDNRSNLPVFGNDFVLLGPYNREVFPGGMAMLPPGKHDEKIPSLFSKAIYPGQSLKGQVAFEIDFPGLEYALILKERSSQQMIYKSSVGLPENFRENKKFFDGARKIFGSGSKPWE